MAKPNPFAKAPAKGKPAPAPAKGKPAAKPAVAKAPPFGAVPGFKKGGKVSGC